MIHESDLVLLHAARSMLKRLEKAAADAAYDPPADGARPVDYGRLSEAASAAEHAIFNTLNVANSYCGANLSYEQLHGKTDPAVTA